jgi:hypothetical protein
LETQDGLLFFFHTFIKFHILEKNADFHSTAARSLIFQTTINTKQTFLAEKLMDDFIVYETMNHHVTCFNVFAQIKRKKSLKTTFNTKTSSITYL